MTTQVSSVDTPYGEARLHRDRSRHPIATLLLGHGAGGGADSADLAALAAELPRQGITVIRLEQPWRVAGQEDRAPARGARPLPRRRRPTGSGPAPRWWSAAAAPGPARRPAPRTSSAPRRTSPWPSRCTRPAGRSGRGSTSSTPWTCPTLVVQGERDPFGTPEEFPDRFDMTVVPGGRPRLQGAQARTGQPGGRAGDRGRGDPGVDRARGRRESNRRVRCCAC